VRTGIPGLAVIFTFALAGCGASSTTSAPTKARFIARADAICGYEEEKLHRITALENAWSASFGEGPRLLRQVAAIHERATTKLESLSKPAGGAATIASWLAARTVAATFEHDAAEAPTDKHSIAAKDIREALARASALVGNLSRRYGFRVCGSRE